MAPSEESGRVSLPFEAALSLLMSGAPIRLADVPVGLGGPAGVFTLWYRDDDRVLYLGRSKVAAGEGRRTNFDQADGVTGRLRGIRRQPALSIQRTLAHEFPNDWKSVVGVSDQCRASMLLVQHGSCRWVETDTGPQADAVFGAVIARLAAVGLKPMADYYR
jgi:hypothetical protein